MDNSVWQIFDLRTNNRALRKSFDLSSLDQDDSGNLPSNIKHSAQYVASGFATKKAEWVSPLTQQSRALAGQIWVSFDTNFIKVADISGQSELQKEAAKQMYALVTQVSESLNDKRNKSLAKKRDLILDEDIYGDY